MFTEADHLQDIIMAQLLRSVVLVSRPWSRATGGRKFPNTTHKAWPALTGPVRRNTATHIGLHHAASRIAWKSRFTYYFSGSMKCEEVEWMLGRKDGGRGSCYLEFASAPNPTPFQQLSKEGNAGHVSLHGPRKAIRIWRQELSNSM